MSKISRIVSLPNNLFGISRLGFMRMIIGIIPFGIFAHFFIWNFMGFMILTGLQYFVEREIYRANPDTDALWILRWRLRLSKFSPPQKGMPPLHRQKITNSRRRIYGL